MSSLITKPTVLSAPPRLSEDDFLDSDKQVVKKLVASSLPQETAGHVSALAASKPKKQILTPLHCNIPQDVHLALHKSMKQHDLGKTDIVVSALRMFLAEYL